MNINPSATGLEGLGEISWGTHFCLFYKTKQDLLDFIVPYLRAGLENHEFCLCVASEPLIATEALREMRAVIPHFERYLAEGQIEITPHTDWYLQDRHFDPERVRQEWIDKLDQALARGYVGMRFAANIAWLKKPDWNSFSEYEQEMAAVLRDLRMEGLCAYRLDRCSAEDVLDVVQHHQFTLVRRNGVWDTLEGSELRQAHEEIQKLNNDLERRVTERTAQLTAANDRLREEIADRRRAETAVHEGNQRWQALFDNSLNAIKILDDETRFVDANPAACALLGYSHEELLNMRLRDVFAEPDRVKSFTQELLAAGRMEGELSLVRQDGVVRQVEYRAIANFRPGLHISLFHDITERKQTERAVQESRAKLEGALNSMTDAVFISDVQGNFLDSNEAFATFHRFRNKAECPRRFADYPEIIEVSFTDGTPVPLEMWPVPRALRGEIATSAEYILCRKDTGEQWVGSYSFAPIRDPGGKIVGSVVVGRDITEHRRAEQALSESEERFSKAFHSNPIPTCIFRWDDGRIVDVNDAYLNSLTGFGRADVIGHTALELNLYVHPEDRSVLLDQLKAGRPVRGEEVSFRTKDGQIRDILVFMDRIELAGEPCVLLTGLDITERNQAEEALKESNLRLQVALEAAQIGIGEWDIPADQATFSDGLRKIFGFPPDKTTARFADFMERILPEDRQRYQVQVDEALKGKTDFKMDYRVVWPDGSLRWATARARISYDPSGKPMRLVGAAIDITERKEAEEALRESEAKLKEAQQLANIGYWEHDLMNDRITGSEETRRILGRQTSDEVFSQAQLQEIIYPEDRQCQQQALDKALHGSKIYDVEYRIIRPDGDLRFVHVRDEIIYDQAGRPIRMVGAMQDITERKQAEESLRESQQLLSLVLATLPVGVAVTDEEGNIILINDASKRIWGGKIVSGRERWTQTNGFWHDTGKRIAPTEWASVRALTEGLTSLNELIDIETYDGQKKIIQNSAAPIRRAEEPIMGAVIVNEDVSERVRAQEENRRHTARMEALAEISRAMEEVGLDYRKVLETITWQIAERIGDRCSIAMFTDDGQRAVPLVYYHPDPKARAVLDRIRQNWIGRTDTQFYQTILAGGTVYIPEVDPGDYRAMSTPDIWPYLDQVGIASALQVPLRVQDRTIGVLAITRDMPGNPYTPEDQILLQDIADRAALTIENARLFQSVSEHQKQLHALSVQLVKAREDDRRAIARELHDEAGQALTALKINLGLIRESLALPAPQSHPELDTAIAITNEVMERIHTLALALRPPALDQVGLSPTLEDLSRSHARLTHLDVQYQAEDVPGLNDEANITLYRFLQEALTNVSKHAQAKQVWVLLKIQDGNILLSVQDDGKGLDPEVLDNSASEQMGLVGMRERLDGLGGSLTIESKPGSGTRLVACIPLQEAQKGKEKG